MTLSLRAARPADDAWLAAWLPKALAGASAPQPTAPPKPLVILRDGGRAGALAFRAHSPAHGAATIAFVATPAEEARRGSGMAAVLLLEARLRRDGMRNVYAPATAAHGISVYFWIRLGYRPLLRAEWPCDAVGIVWLARRI